MTTDDRRERLDEIKRNLRMYMADRSYEAMSEFIDVVASLLPTDEPAPVLVEWSAQELEAGQRVQLLQFGPWPQLEIGVHAAPIGDQAVFIRSRSHDADAVINLCDDEAVDMAINALQRGRRLRAARAERQRLAALEIEVTVK